MLLKKYSGSLDSHIASVAMPNQCYSLSLFSILQYVGYKHPGCNRSVILIIVQPIPRHSAAFIVIPLKSNIKGLISTEIRFKLSHNEGGDIFLPHRIVSHSAVNKECFQPFHLTMSCNLILAECIR